MAQTFVEEFIPKISSVEDVYKFFKELGYNTLTPDYKASLSSFGLRAKEKECVEDIYVISNYDKRFQIYFIKLKTFSNEIIRSLPDLFLKTTNFPFLVLSSDLVNFSFILVEKIRKDVGEFKRKLIRLNIDKNSLYHTDAEVLSNIKLDGEAKPEEIYQRLTEAFSVEKVTDEFFKEYINVFKFVKNYFLKQTEGTKSAHDFTQQLLNRIMFIYFVAKKRWLGKDLKFMSTFWNIYCDGKKKNKYRPDTFYQDWISILFFEAFNNKFSPRNYFPEGLNSILMLSPYLNGGLFTYNKLDDKGFSIEDSVFENIFTFLNRYNFTIREELPLEEEVAVDPEMIGRVYEMLVNSYEESDEQREGGIVYTDRVEIDFMSRRSLVEYFYNQLQPEGISKELVYKFVFAKTEDEKKEAEKELNKLKIWEKIEEALDHLSVLDPACGSGSFLVGMLNILAEFYKIAYKNLNRPIDDFEIKKQIIGRSLYGVDVKEWAVHIAELRLWLQLIVETELSKEDLKIKPLLPNLTFKIRPGDSLVQGMGNINLSLKNNRDISSALKRKLTELKQEKLKFYYNDPSRKFISEKLLLQEELNVFRAILDDRIQSLTNKIKDKQKGTVIKEQKDFFVSEETKAAEEKKQYIELAKKIEEEIEQLTQEKELLIEIRSALDKETKPFIWDIDFVEILSDEFENGFDIVIGNPPYVRQEKIADPKLPKEKITAENKREYKEKLLRSVQNYFPFIKSLDKKSDLYIYFYFQGLALLNQRGTFCFITSNSWLDVGYGKELQEFLLNNVKIHAIYDNSAKRSFARADVNTIIAVISAPFSEKPRMAGKGRKALRPAIEMDCIAKFVMFKKPFDDVVTLNNLLKIEDAEEIKRTDDFRVYPKKQIELLEEGWEYPEEISEEQHENLGFSIGKYTGNKWGGKYLRAPDIFFTILEKGKDKLVRLGDVAEVRRGFTTGCNEFFYLPSKHFDIKKEGSFYNLIPKHEGLPDDLRIEEKYLKPVIISPRVVNKIAFRAKDMENFIFFCNAEEKKKNTGIQQYIKFGEKQEFHLRSTLKAKNPWWQIKEHRNSKLIWAMMHAKRHNVHSNPDGCEVDHNFFEIIPKGRVSNEIFTGQAISTLLIFIKELFGRVYGGGSGPIKNEGVDLVKCPFINAETFPHDMQGKFLKCLEKMLTREIKDVFDELGFNPNLPIRDQEPNPLPDRKELDDIIFDILGLTEAERKEVYWAVCELIKNRLEKARSV